MIRGFRGVSPDKIANVGQFAYLAKTGFGEPKIEENDSKMMSCVKNGKNKKGKEVKQKMSSSKMKKRKNGRKNDGCRNCKKTFRCNLEEAWKLEHWAQKNHMVLCQDLVQIKMGDFSY